MSKTLRAAPHNRSKFRTSLLVLPGLGACAVAVAISMAIHSLIRPLPPMTIAVILGIVLANIPGTGFLVQGILRPGLTFAGKRLMRAGIVFLGLKLSVIDILGLGWEAFGLVAAVVFLAFTGTYYLGRLFRLPGDTPVLLAAGFSICGASAIGAMAAARGSKQTETFMPLALVTLCGTLAIAVLPLLMVPLNLSPTEFGQWTGASVHDVGQVVATAQVAGPAALTAALVIKLTRVLLLAPIVFTAAIGTRYKARRNNATPASTQLPPILPMFIIGFAAMIGLRSFGIVNIELLAIGAFIQDILLGAALFGLGSAVSIRDLLSSSLRGSIVALLAWTLIGVLGYAAILLIAL